MNKKIKIGALIGACVVFLPFALGSCLTRSGNKADTGTYTVYNASDGTERHIYQDTEEFYNRAQSIIDERKANLEKKSVTNTFTANADKTAFYDELQKETRFTDRWLNAPCTGAVTTAFDIIANTINVDTAGEVAEVKIKQFYEMTGKIGLSYQEYIDGEWQTLLTETVTAYLPSIPWDTRVYQGVLNPPDFPNWSGRGLYPNEIAIMRELDTGDISYFILNADLNGSIGVHAVSINGTDGHGHDMSGSEFRYPNTSCYVEDSSGHHDFTSNGNYYINFITPYVNSIFTVLGEFSRSTFMTNLTLADSVHSFYCSYALTNTPEISDDVLNIYNVNNNWEFNQFPIYRITNENFYPNNPDGDYRVYHHYLDQTTINNYADYGFDYDSVNGTLDLDPTVLAGALAGALIPEFQGAFDLIYGAQPAIGMDFNAINNTLDYLDLIEDNQGGGDIATRPDVPIVTTLSEWDMLPSYTTETFPIAIQDGYSTLTLHTTDFTDAIGVTSVFLLLALLGLLIYTVF